MPNKRRRWTKEEEAYLSEHYHKIHYKKIGEHLGKTKTAIAAHARAMGLAGVVAKCIPKFEKHGYDKETLEPIVKDSISYRDVANKLNKTIAGPTYKIIKRAIEVYGIDISHFQPWKHQKAPINVGRPIEFYLNYGSNIGSHHLKHKLYKSGIKQRQCEKCGQGEEWKGEKMSLILDHINGDPKDNRRENLRIVCPNCNATLTTHCRGKKALERKPTEIELQRKKNGGRTDKEIASSLSQRRVERPSRDVILADTKELGFKGASKKYGVSDNSIRKWLK